MSMMEKTRFWRKMGAVLNTGIGASAMKVTTGLINKSAGILMTPKMSGEIPWTPFEKPLDQCKVAFVSTAGFYEPEDEPFDMDAKDGDATFREISSSAALSSLPIAHAHYPHRFVEADPNVLAPLDRFRELEQAGKFTFNHRWFSFGFGGTLTSAFIDPEKGTAHQLARLLKEDGVDVILVAPA